MADLEAPTGQAPVEPLLETPLAEWHRALGGRMVPFAGYNMPVQYPSGILAEHTACRVAAALFDVSHMGQAMLRGPDASAALERLTPADVRALRPGRQRYGLLLNDNGGVIDDFMVARLEPDADGERLFVVFNASRKAEDEAAVRAVLPAGTSLELLGDRALIAVQGPKAEAALAALAPSVAALPFMGVAETTVLGHPAIVSRSGYTGEDGFEVSLPASAAAAVAEALADGQGVTPAGLGARDSLRLEAGLCLYGHELDETTSPVEAALVWTVGKRRRTDWDFAGAARVRRELDGGASRRRVAFAVDGRLPARAGAVVADGNGNGVGVVTSGGFGPTLGAPLAMGYVPPALAADGTAVELIVRGKAVAARVVPSPAVPHRYKRTTPAAVPPQSAPG